MLQKCMHLFAHLAQNLPGPQQWARCDPAKPQRQEPPEKTCTRPLPAVFQQPVLPRGQVLENPIVIPGVCRVVKNMYGAAKTGAYQVVGIYCRRWPAGAGDRDGTGPLPPRSAGQTQTPGVQAGNPKGHRQEKSIPKSAAYATSPFPFCALLQYSGGGRKTPKPVAQVGTFFTGQQPMMYMIQGHPSEQGYPICQKIASRQELPAGLPEKRGGGSTAERALERDQAPGTDAVTHEPGHNYRGYYIKIVKKARGKSKINLEKRELPLRAETLCKQRTVKIKLYNIIASSWNAQKIAAHLSCSPACPQTKYTSSKTFIFPGTVLLCSTQPISTT